MELYGNELDTYRLQRGDLLVVEGNGSATEIGRSAIWEGDIDNCVHQNHIIRVRPLECEPEYLNLYWNSPSGVSQISSKAVTTTGLYSLSTRKVGEIEIPLPPRLEQREIVRRARRVLSVVDNIERSLSQTWTTSSLLQRSILAAAFKPGRE
jgi:type I restriction enzyme S subunit